MKSCAGIVSPGTDSLNQAASEPETAANLTSFRNTSALAAIAL
jgi:hypothetical protein